MINRRTFVTQSLGGLLFAASEGLFGMFGSKKVRFGVVTDLHYADVAAGGSRHYRLSEQKLLRAMETFQREGVDFLIELGDFKDQASPPDAAGTLTYLRTIESIFRSFPKPVYHVLGNHDMDSLTKAEFLENTQNSGLANGKPYYAFRKGPCRFLVLDANFTAEGSDYSRGNFDWTSAMVPQAQCNWLQAELERSDGPVVLFIHQLLDGFSTVPKSVCVKNWPQIVKILEESGKVIAVFQGHHHEGHHSYRQGIHYITHGAMVEGNISSNCYSIVEISIERGKPLISVEGFGRSGPWVV